MDSGDRNPQTSERDPRGSGVDLRDYTSQHGIKERQVGKSRSPSQFGGTHGMPVKECHPSKLN